LILFVSLNLVLLFFVFLFFGFLLLVRRPLGFSFLFCDALIITVYFRDCYFWCPFLISADNPSHTQNRQNKHNQEYNTDRAANNIHHLFLIIMAFQLIQALQVELVDLFLRLLDDGREVNDSLSRDDCTDIDYDRFWRFGNIWRQMWLDQFDFEVDTSQNFFADVALPQKALRVMPFPL